MNRIMHIAAMVLLALAVSFLSVATGCESKPQQSPEAAASSRQASAPAPQAQPEAARAKYTVLDNDPEYVRLRKLSWYDLIDTLQAYKDAVETRESRISAKVGNISDPALYKTLAEDAGKSIPEVNKEDYYDLAKAEQQKQRRAYAEAHKDDYFVVGTYENYFPSTQKAIFNLLKAGTTESAESFAKANFGSALKKHSWGEYDVYDDLGKNVDEYFPVSDDRYKPDALVGCYSAGTEECERALAIPVTPVQMDGAYAAVSRLWGSQMEKMYAEEIRAGGYHHEGKFMPYNNDAVKQFLQSAIRGYVRRQSIWILGRGDAMDPEHVKVREAYLVVGDEEFGRIK